MIGDCKLSEKNINIEENIENKTFHPNCPMVDVDNSKAPLIELEEDNDAPYADSIVNDLFY